MRMNNILLLSGSHRGKKTTTNSILNYMEKILSKRNTNIFRDQVPFVNPDINFVSRINDLLQKCDAFVTCFPLYFDTLPYPLISFLELLSSRTRVNREIKMFTIVHCGLPEATHCHNALDVCKKFSEIMGFIFAGSLIIPDTGAIDGSPVENNKRIIQMLDKAINVLNCPGITYHTIEFISKPSMRPFFFRIIGNIIMKHFARKNKVNVFQKGYDN